MRNIRKIINIIVWLNIFINLGYGQAKCKNNEWKCQNEQCILSHELCDSHENCSDENVSKCDRLYTTTTKNRKTRQINQIRVPYGCRVPYIPNLLVQTDGNNLQQLLAGDYIENLQRITYSCEKRHLLKGVGENYCIDSKWSELLPMCIKYCNNNVLCSITNQPTCEFNGSRVDCRMPILPGTRASIACEIGYQKPFFGVRDNIYCGNDGEWDFLPYRCEQVCGEEHPDIRPFILGGTKTNNTKVPWNVAIYSSLHVPNKLVCGGTIVSAKIVISAAHCFWNITLAQKNDKSYYKVVAGKYYRDYNAVEPLLVQFSDVEEIHITDGYKDFQLSYINDIAIVVLKNYLKFNFYIKPACLKWTEYGEIPMKSNLIGRVAGWGRTANGLQSSELNMVELSTLSYDDCLKKTQKEYQISISGDTFCVNNKDGQSVCEGDSGAGFLIPTDTNGFKRYFLQGIVSNGINSNDECTGDFLTAFTNIQYFKQMVESYINKFIVDVDLVVPEPEPTKLKSDVGGCRVTYISNLIVKTGGDSPQNILPGAYVKNNQHISFSCKGRFSLNGAKDNYCVDSKWIQPHPICTKYCSYDFLRSVTIQPTCEFNGTRVDCQMPILPGTRASIACEYGYQKPTVGIRDNVYCEESGEWNYVPHRCEQICGEEHPDLYPSNIKYNNAKGPWHVGIYSSMRIPNEYICGGTIVSARIVISAAYFLLNSTNNQPHDKSYYKVGAGKYYLEYNAVQPLLAQFSDVAEIKVLLDNDGVTYFPNTIAILVLKNYFKFNFYITPACLKWRDYNKIAMKSNLIGRVTGWSIIKSDVSPTELDTVQLSSLSNDDCLENIKNTSAELLVKSNKIFCVIINSNDVPSYGWTPLGAGFLLPKIVNGVKRYFLQSVVIVPILFSPFLITTSNVQYSKEIIESYMNHYKLP